MDKLLFNPDNYEVKTASVGDVSVTFRAFEGISYCEFPKAPVQKLNIFVPEEFYKGESINGYDLKNAPIFMLNSVGGYNEGFAEVPGEKMFRGHSSERANTPFEALRRGYVVASAGIRGRNSQDGEGIAVGKAPAFIIDMKAAIRYLRHNKGNIPGDTEKIFTNGTSAGGALSALAGATGNSPDYEPYLKEIGAADERDDVFGASCFCPITNLENQDSAYEWQFAGETEFSRTKLMHDENGAHKEFQTIKMTEKQIQASLDLQRQFSDYINSLHLKDECGRDLTLDEEGDGTFADLVGGYIFDSAADELKTHKSERTISRLMTPGTEIDKQEFLDVRDGKLFCLDWDGFIKSIGRIKSAPAYDSLDVDTPENEEFGNTTVPSRHFTKYSYEHSNVAGELAEEDLIKIMNPMNYIGIADTAPNWRIRNGAYDRGLSLAIPIILGTCLQNHGCSVDMAVQWGLSHCGDYDLEGLFAWIDEKCREKQMKAIVAVTENWGIGKDNQLLVSIPGDMKFFRTTTAGAIVIMGRKTLESFPGGRPLKGRINIVITRDMSYAPDGVVIVHDVDAAAKKAMELQKSELMEDGTERNIFVIGGASIYSQMVPMCDTVYVTKVNTKCDADAFFPDLDAEECWRVEEESEEAVYEGMSYRFVTYKKH